jgi:transposase
LGIRGIGPEFATILYTEGLFRHFDNRRQIASYAGLAPPLGKVGTSIASKVSRRGKIAFASDHGPARLAMVAASTKIGVNFVVKERSLAIRAALNADDRSTGP